MSIFCNLQLGLLELQEETPQADINQDNVSLAGVLQGAVGRAVDTPVFALLLDDNTRFSHDRRWDGACIVVGTRLDAVFPILQRLVHADFAAVEIGFYAQCWSCFSELHVGWSEPFLFIFNRKTNYSHRNHKLELTSHCLTSDWQLKDCDTFCSMAYIFKGHLNNTRKWLFVFENIID